MPLVTAIQALHVSRVEGGYLPAYPILLCFFHRLSIRASNGVNMRLPNLIYMSSREEKNRVTCVKQYLAEKIESEPRLLGTRPFFISRKVHQITA